MTAPRTPPIVLALIALASTAMIIECPEGPTETIDMTTEEVIEELGTSTTRQEAAASIRHLLLKTGVGTRDFRSQYSGFRLSHDQIDRLARAQLRFLRDSTRGATLAITYRSLLEAADATDDVLVLNVPLGRVMQTLSEQASEALNDPEHPNNALVLAIAAQDGRLPGPALDPEPETRRSPVQTFLFVLWTITEFQAGDVPPPSLTHQPCPTECFAAFAREIAVCNTLPEPDRRFCVQDAILVLRACIDACHDQGAGG